jgi:hypothetical protein
MNDIKKKYINTFFGNLTNEEKNKIYFEQYMWHAYSYKKLKALEGRKAIEEFKKQDQNGVYILFQDSDDVIEKDCISLNELVDNMEIWGHYDCYIVDKNFKWTFIYTHETYYSETEIVDSNTKHNIYYIGPFFATSCKSN